MQRLDLKCTIARLECMYTLKDIIPRSTNVAKSISFSLSLSLSLALSTRQEETGSVAPFSWLAFCLSLSFARAVGRGCPLPVHVSAPVCYGASGKLTCMQHLCLSLSLALSRSLLSRSLLPLGIGDGLSPPASKGPHVSRRSDGTESST